MSRKFTAFLLIAAISLCALGTGLAVDFSLEDYPYANYVANKKDENLVDMEETLEIKWWGINVNGILPIEDNMMQQVLEKRFNIDIENIQVDVYNKEQANLLLNTGVDFDINTYQGYTFASMVEKELVRPVSLEMLYQYCPKYCTALEEAIGKDWYKLSTVDGQVYGFPTCNMGNGGPAIMVIRTDWLKAIGYDEDNLPTTMEGITEMLAKLHSEDPDGNGVKGDTYALDTFNQGYGQYEFGSFGISHQYWFLDEDGNLSYWTINEKSKEALKLMHTWYDLGIYDPEVITDDRPKTIAKFNANLIGGTVAMDAGVANNGSVTSCLLASSAAEGRNIECTIIPLPEGGMSEQSSTTYSSKGVMFGYNCSDKKLIRLLQIMEAYFADEELYLLDAKGELNLDWGYNEEGDIISGSVYGFPGSLSTENWGRNRYYDYAFVNRERLVKVKLMGKGVKNTRYENYMATVDWKIVPMSNVQAFVTEADSEYGTSANKVADEYFLKAITGEVDIDTTWDDFVKRWLAAGGQEILDAKLALFAE